MTQRHKDVILLVQAHGEGKTIQQRKGGDWVDTNLTLHNLHDFRTLVEILTHCEYREIKEGEQV